MAHRGSFYHDAPLNYTFKGKFKITGLSREF